MGAEDAEATYVLNVAYLATSKKAKRLLREGAPTADYTKKVAEMDALAAQLAFERETDVAFRNEVLKLE